MHTQCTTHHGRSAQSHAEVGSQRETNLVRRNLMAAIRHAMKIKRKLNHAIQIFVQPGGLQSVSTTGITISWDPCGTIFTIKSSNLEALRGCSF